MFNYFTLSITEDINISLYTTGDTETVCTLTDENLTQFKSNDEFIGLNFVVNIQLTPGTYYIKITEYSDLI